MNNKRNRVTLPGKVIEQLYNDEEFYRDVTSIKKLSLSRFPKNDQWISEDSFNMVFALAGYGGADLSIEVVENMLFISSVNQIKSSPDDKEHIPKPSVNHGVVNRGIARRSFRVSYLISEEFDASSTRASMSKGLLSIKIPKKGAVNRKIIKISE